MKNYLVIKNKTTEQVSLCTRQARELVLEKFPNKKINSVVLRTFENKNEAKRFIDRINDGGKILKTVIRCR